MRKYEDKQSRRHVWEHQFQFNEKGGYYLKVHYKPKNRFWKLLHKIGIIQAEAPISEIEQKPMDWEYINVKFTQSDLEGSGAFLTREGTKSFRMTLPNETVRKFDIEICFERLYS